MAPPNVLWSEVTSIRIRCQHSWISRHTAWMRCWGDRDRYASWCWSSSCLFRLLEWSYSRSCYFCYPNRFIYRRSGSNPTACAWSLWCILWQGCLQCRPRATTTGHSSAFAISSFHHRFLDFGLISESLYCLKAAAKDLPQGPWTGCSNLETHD